MTDQATSFYTIKGGTDEDNIIQELLAGLSAYNIWLEVGNEGTMQDFLDSLKGDDGADGLQGAIGPQGDPGMGLDAPEFNEQTGTGYSIDDDDLAGNVVIMMDNASPNTLTVPPDLTGVYPVLIVQKGAGQTTLAAGSGVTINSVGGELSLRTQFSSAHLLPTGTNEYLLVGDITS